jgi:hypothetical protein
VEVVDLSTPSRRDREKEESREISYHKGGGRTGRERRKLRKGLLLDIFIRSQQITE